MFMILVNLLLLVVGCLMTTGEAILVSPALGAARQSYGYDKVLFGLIMILNLEIGYLTPPVAST